MSRVQVDRAQVRSAQGSRLQCHVGLSAYPPQLGTATASSSTLQRTHMQQPNGQDGCENIGRGHGGLGEAEVDGRLVALVEIGQVLDDVRDEAARWRPQRSPTKEKTRPPTQPELRGSRSAPRADSLGTGGSAIREDAANSELTGFEAVGRQPQLRDQALAPSRPAGHWRAPGRGRRT